MSALSCHLPLCGKARVSGVNPIILLQGRAGILALVACCLSSVLAEYYGGYNGNKGKGAGYYDDGYSYKGSDKGKGHKGKWHKGDGYYDYGNEYSYKGHDKEHKSKGYKGYKAHGHKSKSKDGPIYIPQPFQVPIVRNVPFVKHIPVPQPYPVYKDIPVPFRVIRQRPYAHPLQHRIVEKDSIDYDNEMSSATQTRQKGYTTRQPIHYSSQYQTSTFEEFHGPKIQDIQNYNGHEKNDAAHSQQSHVTNKTRSSFMVFQVNDQNKTMSAEKQKKREFYNTIIRHRRRHKKING